MRFSILALPLLCLFQTLLAAPATAHDAKDMLDQQDFSATPPVPSAQVEAWIQWVNSKQGGTYERTGGQPFAAPVPPGLPAGVVEMIVDNDSGVYTTSSGAVICTVKWFDNFLLLRFADGSQFVWMEEGVQKTCSDGSKEHYVKTIGSAGVEDPATGAWTGWIRSSTVDMLAVQKQQKARFRAPAGGTLDLRAASTGAGPWIGSDVDELEIVVGPGGVLDLRDNPAGQGPLFAPGGPVTLRCDTILMDPGVVIADLFAAPPPVQPGALVRGLELHGPPETYVPVAGAHVPRVRVLNTGNGSEPVQVAWIDPAGWSQPQPTALALQSMELSGPIDIPVFVPPATPVGSESLLAVQASAPGGLSDAIVFACRSVDAYNAPLVYCTAKVNSLGCTPRVFATGNPTLSGFDDCRVLADDVLNGMIGILFWGPGAASVPFQAGFLCVQGPIERTPGQTSGGNPGAGSDCSGIYSFHFSFEYLQSQGIVPGSGVWCQYWTRDPSAAFASGLSDGIALHFDA